MPDYKPGQRLNVSFTATVAAPGQGSSAFSYPTPDAPFDSKLYLINIEDAKLDVIETGPEGWPPHIGDVWEADGREYYVRENSARQGSVVISSFEAGSPDFYESQDDLDEFKALKPVLVRRRKESRWEPSEEQRNEAREVLIQRVSFVRLPLGEQIKAVTDVLNAWHEAGETESIAGFAYPWFKGSKYALSQVF